MCGRYTLRTPAPIIAELFGLPEAPDLQAHYNIGPSQQVAAVRLDRERQGRELALLRWGLVPFWADDPKVGYRMINARAETVATKPAFRRAFAKRRCLVVADGFYEWQKANGPKQPFYVRLKEDRPFAFAGLWERWRRDEEQIDSCTIIVTGANELLEPIHDRMPVIIPPEHYALWLDSEVQGGESLQNLLRPYPANRMTAYPVSRLVNKPENDLEQCIEPAS